MSEEVQETSRSMFQIIDLVHDGSKYEVCWVRCRLEEDGRRKGKFGAISTPKGRSQPLCAM